MKKNKLNSLSYKEKRTYESRAYSRKIGPLKRVMKKVDAIKNLGGKCSWCGIDPEELAERCEVDVVEALYGFEVDHIVPLMAERKRPTRLNGLHQAAKGNTENLQLLCGACHGMKTRRDLGGPLPDVLLNIARYLKE